MDAADAAAAASTPAAGRAEVGRKSSMPTEECFPSSSTSAGDAGSKEEDEEDLQRTRELLVLQKQRALHLGAPELTYSGHNPGAGLADAHGLRDEPVLLGGPSTKKHKHASHAVSMQAHQPVRACTSCCMHPWSASPVTKMQLPCCLCCAGDIHAHSGC